MAGILKVDKYQDFNGNDIMTSDGNGTITMPSGVISGQNYPAFEAYKTSNQTITKDAWVKVTFDTETYDTDSAFASDKFTIPSGQAGKYYIYSSLRLGSTATRDIAQVYLGLYKNGIILRYVQVSTYTAFDLSIVTTSYATVLDAEVGDYYEIYVYVDTNTASPIAQLDSNFGAYRIGA